MADDSGGSGDWGAKKEPVGKEIGNTGVVLFSTQNEAIRFRMPVPPSTNRRQTIGYRKKSASSGMAGMGLQSLIPIIVLTKTAREYLELMRYPLNVIRSWMHLDPISEYTAFRMWWVLANERYDNHNGLKLLCDALENGRIVSDDRFIMPQVMGVEINMRDPHVRIEFYPMSRTSNLG